MPIMPFVYPTLVIQKINLIFNNNFKKIRFTIYKILIFKIKNIFTGVCQFLGNFKKLFLGIVIEI